MTMIRQLKMLFLGISLAVSVSSCPPANPYFIQAVIIVGGFIVRTTIAEVIEQTVDRIFDTLFGKALDETPKAVPIEPLAKNPLLGRKIGDHQYSIEGKRYGRTSSVEFVVPTKLVLFARADENSPWDLTPESRELIHERMDIAGAQLSLHDLGYDPGSVDGIMGKKTKRAIRAFQKDRELLPTGELNALTRQLLFMR